MIIDKECLACHKKLPLGDFGVDNSKKDLLQIYCRQCKKYKEKKYYMDNFGKISQRRKEIYKNNPYKAQKSNKEWYLNQISNPQIVQLPQEWYFEKIKKHAESRKSCPFLISYHDLINSYTGICALTGEKLICTKTRSQSSGNQTASLDRIDSKRGYSLDNIQWVDWRINHLKGDINQIEFIELCKKVTSHQKLSASPLEI